MRKFAAGTIAFVAFVVVLLFAAPAQAGNGHFVGSPTVTTSGDTITATGKIAGLGNEAQVEVTLTATAECVNKGGNKPAAENKDTVSVSGVFPVQNGHADFSLTGTAVFSPACVPPMTVEWSAVSVTF